MQEAMTRNFMANCRLVMGMLIIHVGNDQKIWTHHEHSTTLMPQILARNPQLTWLQVLLQLLLSLQK